ncbi:MAG: hypothetical protein LBK29_01260 [Oscillospiraceae bacterium]|jgi:DNA polymerase III delta prime subunit|nr:hypothetical protein [Oscillospiraceae bacterium]
MKNAPHAVIFECDPKVALVFAKDFSIALLGDEHKRKIKKEIHPDMFFLPMGKKQKIIGISEIRFIIKNSLIKPIESDFKIYILKDAQTLTEQAQNAFLKILEEPSKNIFFILLCANSNQLLATLVSRAVVFKNQKIIENYLTKKAHETDCLMPRIRDNDLIYSAAENLIAAIIKKNKFEILSVFAPFLKKRDDLIAVFTTSKEILLKICKKDPSFIYILDILDHSIDLVNLNLNTNLASCLSVFIA